MLKSKHIEIPIYKRQLTFIDCDNLDELDEFFKDLGYNIKSEYSEIDQLLACTIDGKMVKNGKKDWSCIYVLFNRTGNYQKITIGTLAHEALHVVMMVWRHIGATCVLTNEEPECYLIGYIVNEMCDFLEIKREL